MKSLSEVSVKVVVEMDLREARWLQAIMQNPLHGQHPVDEDAVDNDNRLKLFNVLKQQTENHA